MAAPAAATSVLHRRGGLDVLTWPAFDCLDLDALVTTRHGGVSAGPYDSLNLGLHVGDDEENVLRNRRIAAEALGASLDELVFCNQTHGSRAQVVTIGDRGRGSLSRRDAIDEADALVTADPGVGLVIMVADCVPIVLYDPAAHVLGCVHAGWRGTVARVCESALAAMGTLGARPENVIAGIGPAITPGAYQVGAEVIRGAERGLGVCLDDVIRPDGHDRWLFDLPKANRLVLEGAGVRAGNIHVTQVATGVGAGLFFSDREARPCGRFAAIARLRAREGR